MNTKKENIITLSKSGHYFFGYYNKSPWNFTQDKILFLKSKFINRHPKKDDLVEIGFFDIKTNEETILSKTNTWNWQQGCMLQWHPSEEDIVIFNKRKNNKFISVFFNIKTRKETIMPLATYDINSQGNLIASLNFSRLNKIRKGYGYEGLPQNDNEAIPKDDGIFIFDIKTKVIELAVSVQQLSKINPVDSMNYGNHWVNHIEFNPKGDKLYFFHRWKVPGNMHYSRFYVLDIRSNKLSMLPDSGFYSHYCWKNNNEILIWTAPPGKIGDIRKNEKLSKYIFKFVRPIYKKIIPQRGRARILNLNYCLFSSMGKFIKKIPIWTEDGHPSFSPNKRFILTDTYPDKTHHRTLIIYDTKLKQKHVLNKFHSLPNKKYSKDPNWDSSGMRCDLHPRWNRDGTQVCIDSVHEGFRGMYIIDVSKITK